MTVTGKTRLYGIIGAPVSHTLSPPMQNAAFQASGLDCCYVPFPVMEQDQVENAVKGLKALGVYGFNVTIPFKEAILPYLDELTPAAKAIGAVNAVKRDGNRFIGHNTDGIGLLRSIAEDFGIELEGKKVLLIGAGGAARAATGALCTVKVNKLVIANRSTDRAEALAKAFQGQVTQITSVDLSILNSTELASFDLVINSSSVGMGGSRFDTFDAGMMNICASLYDMVYVPAQTPLIAEALSRGIRCANGLGMLAGQGEAAFSWWTGVEPKCGLMKQVLLTQLTS